MMTQQKITPFLWFDNQAEDAVKFYTKIFKNSKIGKSTKYDGESAKVSGQKENTIMLIDFTLSGQSFGAMNAGPLFKFNPSVSFFINCSTKKEVDEFYAKLSKGGIVRMALDKYPFSERYAFISDKYGVSWQIILSNTKVEKKIVPSLLFVNNKIAKAEEAVKFYTKVFKDSKVKTMMPYDKKQAPKGSVMYSEFIIEGETFSLMSGIGDHKFDFNEAISFIINCKDQKEVDYYWNNLISGGGQESQCGWLKDKFGVSWQVTPTMLLEKHLNSKDKTKVKNMLAAMYKMRKLDIAKLEKAYNGK
ncbi:MAG TPA: VOC family protein [Alphaproteobacteria bacterium]|nr:VOC family protein [Alphaproteobacteria bacterium]